MLMQHAAIVKDKIRFVGTFKVIEPNCGSQRREHGKSPISMLTSRSVLTLTRATEVSPLTFFTYFVFNTMRQDLSWESPARKWETRSEKPIFTSRTSGFWPKTVSFIATKWWYPSSSFGHYATFHQRNKCSIAFMDTLYFWKKPVGVDWMNLKK